MLSKKIRGPHTLRQHLVPRARSSRATCDNAGDHDERHGKGQLGRTVQDGTWRWAAAATFRICGAVSDHSGTQVLADAAALTRNRGEFKRYPAKTNQGRECRRYGPGVVAATAKSTFNDQLSKSHCTAALRQAWWL
jgi:hypothetical protein